MDFRFLVIALVGATALYFVLEGTPSDRDDRRAALPAEYQRACTEDPGMCDCFYPLLQFIDENEELREMVAGTPSRLGRAPTIREWAAEWMNDELPRAAYWVQVSERRLDHRQIHDCVYRVETAQQRGDGHVGLPTFQEAADSYRDRR